MAYCTEAQVEAKTLMAIGNASSDDATSAQFTQALNDATAEINASLPERYRKMLSRVEGEFMTRYALGTETTFTASIGNVTTGTLYLYLNFPTDKLFSERTPEDRMLSTEYSVSTNTITMTSAVPRGSTLIAEYYHSLATVPAIIQTIATALTSGYLYGAITNRSQPSDTDYQQMFMTEGRTLLKQIRDGETGIYEFDQVDLWDDAPSPSQSRFGTVRAIRA